jgi:serine/threonine protein kinase
MSSEEPSELAETCERLFLVASADVVKRIASREHEGMVVYSTSELHEQRKALDELFRLARTGELRDVDFSLRMAEGLFGLLLNAWVVAPLAEAPVLSALPAPSLAPPSVASGSRPVSEVSRSADSPQLQYMRLAYQVFLKITSFPELDPSVAGEGCPPSFLTTLVQRTLFAPQSEQSSLNSVLQWVYRNVLLSRRKLRSDVGVALQQFAASPAALPGVKTLLQLVGAAVRGIPESESIVLSSLVRDVLLPLHSTNAMVTEQNALIEMYHQPLVFALESTLRVAPQDMVMEAWEGITATWPRLMQANSPKRVQILHELDRLLLNVVPPSLVPQALTHAAGILREACASEHSREAQRLLSFFANDAMQAKLRPFCPVVVGILLPSLVRGGSKHWNATVNKMSLNVLTWMASNAGDKMEELLPIALESPDSIALDGTVAGTAPHGVDHAPPPPVHESDRRFHFHGSDDSKSMLPPPPRPVQRSSHKCPVDGKVASLVGTGLATAAPWLSKAVPPGGGQPPLTTTGAAPWTGGHVTRPGIAERPHRAHSHLAAEAAVLPSASSDEADITEAGYLVSPVLPVPEEVREASPALAGVIESLSKGSSRARMVRLVQSMVPPPLPKEVKEMIAKAEAPVESKGGGLVLSPSLIPGLKFHDLVFGRELGSGAFSTVKWCKRIVRETPQSTWPEFAVKVISTETINRLGYERSVEREIAVLRRMTHPGISRLVASFRYGDGAYLVLEYASRGDLHAHITRLGSLSLDSARFAVGEIVAALEAIHGAGFIYGDLKPENVLLTEGGHCKLADFGGARPFTAAATAAVEEERDILKRLPNGSWKEQDLSEPSSSSAAEASEEDERLEGTALYLAPELARGGRPSPASDCWALGCVVYFAIAGRPPLWAESADEVMRRVVEFDVSASFPEDFPEDARDLVLKLLTPDPSARLGGGASPHLSMEALKKHPFFSPLPAAVDSLFSLPAPPMSGGSVAPQADAKWAKRQFSMMYSPMPDAFEFSSSSGYADDPVTETPLERGCPFGVPLSASVRVVASSSPGSAKFCPSFPVIAETDDMTES